MNSNPLKKGYRILWQLLFSVLLRSYSIFLWVFLYFWWKVSLDFLLPSYLWYVIFAWLLFRSLSLPLVLRSPTMMFLGVFFEDLLSFLGHLISKFSSNLGNFNHYFFKYFSTLFSLSMSSGTLNTCVLCCLILAQGSLGYWS